MNEGQAIILGTVITMLVIVTLVGWFLFTTVVPAGHVGVGVVFGDVDDIEFQSGLSIKNPLMSVEMLSVQTQSEKYNANVLTREGLTVGIELTAWFHLQPDSASNVFEDIGRNYAQKIVTPRLRSAIRSEIATFNVSSIYSEDRGAIETAIFTAVESNLLNRGVVLEQVMIRNVAIPEQITAAIEEKQSQQEKITKKQWEVEEERLEATRKTIEAQGIADSNEIISESLTENYLTWYWIKDGLQKGDVYYVPVGNTGLPLIKDIGE